MTLPLPLGILLILLSVDLLCLMALAVSATCESCGFPWFGAQVRCPSGLALRVKSLTALVKTDLIRMPSGVDRVSDRMYVA